MMISEFSRAAGLSQDAVRFYVRKGLLKPERGLRGGRNAYQLFDQTQLQAVRMIRAAQLLGFSLREIAALNEEFQQVGLSRARKRELMRGALAAIEEKAARLALMQTYFRAKIAWLEGGEKGEPPQLEGFDCPPC